MYKQQFLEICDKAIKEGVGIKVFVTLPGNTGKEIITNIAADVKNKRAYYDRAYDELMCLKANPEVKIHDIVLHESGKNYFSYKELCASKVANEKGIVNIPSDAAFTHLRTVTRPHMNIIREFVGVPWIVTSGYRTQELNSAVGGVPTSRHTLGLAVDGYPASGDLRETWEKIQKQNYWFIDQCILYEDKGFIHLGFAVPGETPRRMYFEK